MVLLLAFGSSSYSIFNVVEFTEIYVLVIDT